MLAAMIEAQVLSPLTTASCGSGDSGTSKASRSRYSTGRPREATARSIASWRARVIPTRLNSRASTWPTPTATAWRRVRRSRTSRWAWESFLESSRPGSRAPSGSTAAPATTGPASGPRPTSSTPATTLKALPRAVRSPAPSCARRVLFLTVRSLLTWGRAGHPLPGRGRLRLRLGLRLAAVRLGLGVIVDGHRLGGDRLRSALLDAAFLADLVPEVVQACLADVAVAEHLDLVDAGRVDHEGPLDADAVGAAAHREVLPKAAAGNPDDQALEDLDPLAGPFNDLGVDADGVARPELGHGLLELLLLDLVDHVHLFFSPCRGVPARASVRRRACACLQASISRWLPESSTSGTRRPRNSAGRVYCGWPRRSAEKESPVSDSSSPSTPGTKRETASITTIAGSPA